MKRFLIFAMASSVAFMLASCVDFNANANNANLSELVLSSGELTPAFKPDVTKYTVSVDYTVTEITATGTAESAAATVGGQSGQSVSLAVGDTDIAIEVTAEDGVTVKTYTVTVTREEAGLPSTNANLSEILLSAGSLTPAFAPNVTAYAVSVPYGVTEITATGTAVSAAAAVGGQSGQSVPLAVGETDIAIEVTAEDGVTVKTYTVTVTREEAVLPSTNANLSEIVLSAGSLTPAFASNVTAYAVSVPYGVTEITATGTAESAAATVGGQSGQSVSLAVGDTDIAIEVTAEDGVTVKTYTVTVTREEAVLPSANANLSKIELSAGSLTPAFAPNVTAYAVSVPYGVTEITATGTAESAAAAVGGQSGQSVSLAVGDTDIAIDVTAEDGVTVKTYTVTVTRANIVKVINANNYDPSALSDGEILAAASLDVYLEHASVGGYITGGAPIGDWPFDGLGALAAADSRYACGRASWESPSTSSWNGVANAAWFDTNNGLGDLFRGNPSAATKVSGFEAAMNYSAGVLGAAVDVAMFKFCYIDSPASSTVQFDTARAAIERLEASYPNVTFVWWTMPIEETGNAARQGYNDLVRTYCNDNDKWLYDIADLESHDDSGMAYTDSFGHEVLYAGYSHDGGHPNGPGVFKLAKAYWKLIAEIAKTR